MVLPMSLEMKQPSYAGFTLLEILVVLVIMNIVAGMAVLTIDRNANKRLQTFTQTLMQSLTLAEEQALLQPATLGLAFTPHSFCFYEYRLKQKGARWEPLSTPELGLHAI